VTLSGFLGQLAKWYSVKIHAGSQMSGHTILFFHFLQRPGVEDNDSSLIEKWDLLNCIRVVQTDKDIDVSPDALDGFVGHSEVGHALPESPDFRRIDIIAKNMISLFR
jgi:hypothetical protein